MIFVLCTVIEQCLFYQAFCTNRHIPISHSICVQQKITKQFSFACLCIYCGLHLEYMSSMLWLCFALWDNLTFNLRPPFYCCCICIVPLPSKLSIVASLWFRARRDEKTVNFFIVFNLQKKGWGGGNALIKNKRVNVNTYTHIYLHPLSQRNLYRMHQASQTTRTSRC